MEAFRNKIASYEKTIGKIASIIAVLMFASLIEVFLSNLRGDSHIFVQPTMTAINGLFWSLYAIIKKDTYLLIPNALGLVFGIATVITAFI